MIPAVAQRLALLNIPKAGFWAGGRNAKGDYAPLLRQNRRLRNARAKNVRVADGVVRRQHQHKRIVAPFTQGKRCQGNGWRGIARRGFQQNFSMSRSACVAGIVFVFPPDQRPQAEALLADLHKQDDLGLPWTTASGGPLRQDSVRLGLAALPERPACVLVHGHCWRLQRLPA